MKLILGLVLALFTVTLAAQTTQITRKIDWEQTAADGETASGYIYRVYADGAATGTALGGVSCVLTLPPAGFHCSATLPALTGVKMLTLSAQNTAGESPKSPAFPINLPPTPGKPTVTVTIVVQP